MAVRAETFEDELQYISDPGGQPKAVIVPIEVWKEISSERETAHLLSSPAMRQRLLEAKKRQHGIPWEKVRADLGV